MGCFAEMPWLIRVIRLRCTKSCAHILAAVAGFHLLISQHLFKLLEASFAAVDLFRLRCEPLTLLPQVDGLIQSFLLIIPREHVHQLRSHHLCSFCANRRRSTYCARCLQLCRFRIAGKVLPASFDGEYLAINRYILLLPFPIDLFTKNKLTID